MSETGPADKEMSNQDNNDNAEQLKHMTLNEQNGVSDKTECTPTLDYLQVP